MTEPLSIRVVRDQVIRRGWPSVVYRPLYRVTCLPSQEWQRCKLESLRYRFGRYHGGIMQQIGDIGRTYAGYLAALKVWR